MLGTGAVGGLYGAMLHRAGQEVHFLVHRDYAWVRDHGLRVTTKTEDFTLEVSAYDQVGAMPRCDVVLIALKATQNHLLLQLLPPVLKADGLAVLLQNGLGAEEWLADLVGAEWVVGGLCFLCANQVGPGHIHHLDYGEITLGTWLASETGRLVPLIKILQQAGIAVQLTPDLPLARWRKLLWNIPFNGLSVLLGATTQAIMENPHSRALAEALMIEVQDLAQAVGHPLPPGLTAQLLDHTRQMQPYQTSMKLDYDRGRPLEVEAIFGNPLRQGKLHGQLAPCITTLYQLLKALDNKNSPCEHRESS
ncbi:putative 2-dehydropantoate 2-reductase [Candidatus Cyanaurora vandensis]|uniref:putative 2-dehydropantoate 2-reductase n=1 Tax=Candidatus Cyanaurora vandensis TaxID=2714958 RepID=UPI0025797763|nr:putative 2-dehydropantoate 2-reductase [Candidatus Cyanaurora vandensis]